MLTEKLTKSLKMNIMTSTFELIMLLRNMEIGEEREIGKHKIKRITKYRFDYVCSCCLGKRSLRYGKQ